MQLGFTNKSIVPKFFVVIGVCGFLYTMFNILNKKTIISSTLGEEFDTEYETDTNDETDINYEFNANNETDLNDETDINNETDINDESITIDYLLNGDLINDEFIF